MTPEGWFPSKDSQRVVGQVIDSPKIHQARSREENCVVTIMVPVMASKVAGESDISTQELKKHNTREFAEICARFPGAWEAYEKRKAAEATAPVVNAAPKPPVVVSGTDIEHAAAFISPEKIVWLKAQGFSTVEQLADITASQIQSLGRGAGQWKKKAQTMLKDMAKA